MKEKLYTIELTDAVNADEECCFCWLARKLEQENLEFVLGSSYMESDIREQTDHQGVCRHHTQMMYDYGNSLGNAWILKSRLEYLKKELAQQMKQYSPGKSVGFLERLKKAEPAGNGVERWIRAEEGHCYVCDRMKGIYERMLDTFVYLLRNDAGFGEKLLSSKGFCIHHFADVLKVCERELTEAEKAIWMPKLFALVSRNLNRMQEDIDWLIEKYDYRNQDADWRNSKDAVQRTMQKIVGGFPGDPVFQNKK